MELLSLKIIALTASGVVRIFFGLIPLIIFRGLLRGSGETKRIRKVISYLMFFGGGVLLATCLVHMMPEVREMFASADLGTDLPVADIVFISGFFLIYFLEDIIHAFIHNRRKRRKHRKEASAGTGVQNQGFSYITPPPTVSGKQMFGHHRGEVIPGITTSIPRVRSDNGKLNGSLPTISDPKFTYIDTDWGNVDSQLNLVNSHPNLNLRSNSMYEIPLNNGHSHHSAKRKSLGAANEWSPSSSASTIEDEEHDSPTHAHAHAHGNGGGGHGHSHMVLPVADDESVAATFRNLIIVIAMSFHGIFEGLAIGLQGSEKAVLQLLLAVSLHECTILFCIGVELIASKTKVLRMITYIMVVSLVCPIGIAIGIVVSESSFDGDSVEKNLVIGSLTGLAAGTLLYVTFFEIFAAEAKNLKSKYVHILVAALGFIGMVLLELAGGHSHGGGGGHGHSHTSSVMSPNSTLIADNDHDHDHGPTHHHSDVHDHSGHGHSHSH